MKPYLVFACIQYEAQGGVRDFKQACATLDEAKAVKVRLKDRNASEHYDYVDIAYFNGETLEVIESDETYEEG
jgi:hypothetical protein